MNPISTGVAIIKVLNSIRWYNSHGKQIDALHEAGDYEAERKLICELQVKTIADINRKLGLTYTVVGRENIPEDDTPVMFYANHQGYADLFAIFEAIQTKQIGFLSKAEFKKWPLVKDVIKYTRSIFLVRGGGREAIQALKECKELISQGFNVGIFPEGTRARGPVPGEFKHGAFKFAQKSKVAIVPISIDGTYRLFEEKGTYQKCHSYIKIHPIVHIEEMSRAEQDEAFKQIEKTIKDGLLELREIAAQEEESKNA